MLVPISYSALAVIAIAVLGSPAAAQTTTDRPEVFVADANHPGYKNTQDKIAQYIITDEGVTGALLLVPWSAVDKGAGVFDWTFVEDAMAPWIRAGKVVGLSFYGVEERTTWNYDGVPATPKYVLDRVDTIRCNVAGEPQLPNVPVYLEPPYADNYKRLISAATRKYERDPRVSYIRFGLGAGDESFPANKLDLDPACKAAWAAHGLSFDRWLTHTVGLIDYMGRLEPKTRIFVAFNDLGGLDRQANNRNIFARTVAETAANYHFTIGNEGFGYTLKFNEIYRDFSAKTPLYMQTGSVARINDHPRFQSILATARDLNIRTFELYVRVWLIANDPRNPLHNQYGSMYRAALDSLSKSK